jgi:hypothetical protein
LMGSNETQLFSRQQYTSHTKRAILYLRDRAALIRSGDSLRHCHNFTVVLALLVITIVSLASSISKVKVACCGLAGKGIVVLGYEVDSSKVAAEFRYMWFCIRKYISVVDPTPDKKIPVEVSLSGAFSCDDRTKVNTENQWFGDEMWNPYSSRSFRRDTDSREIHISALELFVSWLRFQFLDLKDADYTGVVLPVRQMIAKRR